MKINNWREFAFIFMIIASILWFILTFLAMLFYAGGSYVNPNSPGYDFFSNFNSDLGRTVAHSGRPNTISFIIFTINSVLFSVSLMLFWIAIYHFFSENGIKKWMSLVATIFGIFVAIGFLGIVFTPADLYLGPHRMFTNISFSALLIVIILYAIAIYLNEDYPNRYCYVHIIYIIIVAIYLILRFTGPSITTAEGLRIQATSQKILLFCGVFDVLIQGYGAWKLETS